MERMRAATTPPPGTRVQVELTVEGMSDGVVAMICIIVIGGVVLCVWLFCCVRR